MTGTSYALFTTPAHSRFEGQFAPFLLPNQYVNYGPDSEVCEKGGELTADSSDTLGSIANIYNYVAGSFSYDNERAGQRPERLILPDLDDILAKRKGILLRLCRPS